MSSGVGRGEGSLGAGVVAWGEEAWGDGEAVVGARGKGRWETGRNSSGLHHLVFFVDTELSKHILGHIITISFICFPTDDSIFT